MIGAAAHLLPDLDWLIKLAIGLIVAAAGVLLFRQATKGGLLFALDLLLDGFERLGKQERTSTNNQRRQRDR